MGQNWMQTIDFTALLLTIELSVNSHLLDIDLIQTVIHE